MTELFTFAFLPSLGGQEMIIILLIVLLLFGAKKLPELARGMGKSLGEFKKAKDEFEEEITRAADEVNVDKTPKAAKGTKATNEETAS